jgi:hypothetical protein
MPATPYIKLFGQDGSAKVRSALTAIGATWTPEDEGTPKNFILDARAFETVRITPVFLDGGGLIVDGTSVDVVPLILVPDSRATTTGGRLWRVQAAIGATTDAQIVDVDVHGHMCAFRLTALTLGAAISVDLIVTGGVQLPIGIR